jgi:hypothetical protein
MGKLDAAARHPGMLPPAHFQRCVRGERLACLVDLALSGIDQSGQDQGLCPRSALDEAAINKELVSA